MQTRYGEDAVEYQEEIRGIEVRPNPDLTAL